MHDLAQYIRKSQTIFTENARFSHLMVCVIIIISFAHRNCQSREKCANSHMQIFSDIIPGV